MKSANSIQHQDGQAGTEALDSTQLLSDEQLDSLAAGATLDEIWRSLDSLLKLGVDMAHNEGLSREAKDAAISAAYKAEYDKLFPASGTASH